MEVWSNSSSVSLAFEGGGDKVVSLPKVSLGLGEDEDSVEEETFIALTFSAETNKIFRLNIHVRVFVFF